MSTEAHLLLFLLEGIRVTLVRDVALSGQEWALDTRRLRCSPGLYEEILRA